MRYFASLEADGKCTGIQTSEREVNGQNVIEVTNAVNIGIPSDDFMWRKYVNGQWSTEKFLPPEPPPAPDLKEDIKQLKSRQADILMAMVMNNLM